MRINMVLFKAVLCVSWQHQRIISLQADPPGLGGEGGGGLFPDSLLAGRELSKNLKETKRNLNKLRI